MKFLQFLFISLVLGACFPTYQITCPHPDVHNDTRPDSVLGCWGMSDLQPIHWGMTEGKPWINDLIPRGINGQGFSHIGQNLPLIDNMPSYSWDGTKWHIHYPHQRLQTDTIIKVNDTTGVLRLHDIRW